MSNIFVRSTDGNDVDNGSTWALAKATLSGAAAIDAAGDTIFVSDNHAESSIADQTIALAGTFTSPVRVICVDDAGDPASPTTTATTGTVTVTGASTDIIFTGNMYVRGLTFTAGSGTNATNTIQLGDTNGSSSAKIRMDSCKLRLGGTGSSSLIRVGDNTAATANSVTLENTWMKFAATDQYIHAYCALEWTGGGMEAGSSSPSYLI